MSEPRHPPSLAALARKYRLASHWYDATRWAFIVGRGAAVRACQLKHGDTVLELGCGTGANLRRLCRRVGRSGRVLGLDYVPEMLARARPKAASLVAGGFEVTLSEGDAAALSYPDSLRADAVLLSYSLAMIPDWHAALKEAGRVLAPGGRIVALDFGDLRGCPEPVRGLLVAWLRRHGVRPERDFAQAFADRLGAAEITERVYFGHYARLVAGVIPGARPPAVAARFDAFRPAF